MIDRAGAVCQTASETRLLPTSLGMLYLETLKLVVCVSAIPRSRILSHPLLPAVWQVCYWHLSLSSAHDLFTPDQHTDQNDLHSQCLSSRIIVGIIRTFFYRSRTDLNICKCVIHTQRHTHTPTSQSDLDFCQTSPASTTVSITRTRTL